MYQPLTSSVVQTSPDGNYPYYYRGILIGHEFLRHEFLRVEEILDKFNPLENRWKIPAFHEYFMTYFLPALHFHHDIEDKIFFPFYISLDAVVNIPEKHSEDHVVLDGRLSKIKLASENLNNMYKLNQLDDAMILEKSEFIKIEIRMLIDSAREHFKEEEEYWPAIIKNAGHKNYMKLTHLILESEFSLGDFNAASPVQLALAATADAMGIRYPSKSDAADSQTTGWASPDFQKLYIGNWPSSARAKLPSWMKRFAQMKLLLKSIGEDKPLIPMKSDGTYVDKMNKTPTFIILFFFICSFYCLIVTPYFASVNNPAQNLFRLDVYITNFDSDTVGNSLVTYLQEFNAANSPVVPTFRYRNALGTNPSKLKGNVLDLDAWGSIHISADATSNLNAAVANGCANAASYDGSRAIVFQWDEGRNSAVADPYINLLLSNVLVSFSASFASSYMSTLSNSTIQSCIANGYSSILTQPVFYTNYNLTPIKVMPLSVNAINIGNIYVALFGSLVFIGAIYHGTAPYSENMTPLQRVLFRPACLTLLSFGLGICFSTIVVGLTAVSSSREIYSGETWGQIFGTIMVHTMIWSFGNSCLIETVGEGLQPVIFSFLMMSSIIGGSNVDLAYKSYYLLGQNFYQIFPFHWSIFLMKWEFYGSCRTLRGISAGILCAYCIFFFCLYVFFAMKNEYKKIRNDTPEPDAEDLNDPMDANKVASYAMVSKDENVNDDGKKHEV